MTSKEKKGNFVVRVSPEMHERLAQHAENQRRSLNSQIALIFDTYFDIDLARQRVTELERTLSD